MEPAVETQSRGPLWLRWADTPMSGVFWALGIGAPLVAIVLLSSESAELGWRTATRLTVQFAYVFFLLAFSASSLVRLRPSPTTRALLARRRAIGLAFATAMGLHAISIVSLSTFDESTLTPDLATFLGGGAYVWIAMMAATSNDTAVRRLGRGRWRALHLSGQVILFFVFLASYAGRFAEDSSVWVGFALLLGALSLRVAATFQSLRFRRMTLPTE